MICINCGKGSPPFHDLSAEGEKPRLVCHGCWTLGGLLHDEQAEGRVVKIVHEAGGYVAECRCGWAKWSTHKPHVEQAAMAHAERCQEMEGSC